VTRRSNCVGFSVLVFPFKESDDLRELARSATVKTIKQYMRALFGALAAVHASGLIHRDVKASNFLFSKRLGSGVLIDFGLVDRLPSPAVASSAAEEHACESRHTQRQQREGAAAVTGSKRPSAAVRRVATGEGCGGGGGRKQARTDAVSISAPRAASGEVRGALEVEVVLRQTATAEAARAVRFCHPIDSATL
jgi:serine/threonine protein kinase